MSYKKSIKQKIDYLKDLIKSPEPQPKRDWVFMIFFFFSVFTLSLIMNSLFFFQEKQINENENIQKYSQSYSTSVGKKEKEDELLQGVDLENLWVFFKEKEEEFDLLSHYLKTRVVDQEQEMDLDDIGLEEDMDEEQEGAVEDISDSDNRNLDEDLVQ